MTTNADRFTLPSSDLIVHGRTVHPVRATCNCTRQLADALEAAEAQVARNIDLLSQVARLRSHMRCIAQACQEHGSPTAVAQQALQDGQYPADLLTAVRLLDGAHVHDCAHPACQKAVATLRRYGLLPEEAR